MFDMHLFQILWVNLEINVNEIFILLIQHVVLTIKKLNFAFIKKDNVLIIEIEFHVWAIIIQQKVLRLEGYPA
jgi:hypothetical protein